MLESWAAMSTSTGYMSTHSEKLHAAAPTAATAVAGDTVTVTWLAKP